MTANEAFYRTFNTSVDKVAWELVYELNDGQWDIPSLRRLLEEILPLNTFFKDFEVDHVYPGIGRKIILLNAREVHVPNRPGQPKNPKLIILAMEDVTKERNLEEKLEAQTLDIEDRLLQKTADLEKRIKKLENRS